jgi:hypothetical protein
MVAFIRIWNTSGSTQLIGVFKPQSSSEGRDISGDGSSIVLELSCKDASLPTESAAGSSAYWELEREEDARKEEIWENAELWKGLLDWNPVVMRVNNTAKAKEEKQRLHISFKALWRKAGERFGCIVGLFWFVLYFSSLFFLSFFFSFYCGW